MADEDQSTLVQDKGPHLGASSFRVRVIHGQDTNAEVTLGAHRTLVGSGPACDLRLTDPTVSRRHLALEMVDGAVVTSDLDSSNGTFIGPTRITQAWAQPGDVISIGDTRLQVLAAAEEPAAHMPTRRDRFGRLVGASPQMQFVYAQCAKAAASDVPVVVEGETGTGKEVIAESIHEASPRRAAPFVVFDCTAVPPNLVEAELFGHERGAFTGAHAARKGVFEQAHGGTLFIDEIGDLEYSLQPKLLRALERSEVRRIGGDKWIRVDVRIVAATRRDLDHEVEKGRFRDDLFFRLAVARIELPPLRRRQGDISLLAGFFWSELGGGGTIPYDFAARLERHDWPGNVRELRNAVARHLAMGDETLAVAQVKPEEIDDVLELDLPFPRARRVVQSLFERRYIERILEKHGNDVERAAAASGIARRYFSLIRARGR